MTNNAASTQPPRELLDLYREPGPGYENVHRGQSTASQRTDGAVRGVLRHDRGLAQRAQPAEHRHLPQHHRGAQRGHVLAADGVPRRRQRGHHDAGAQLQLRPLARALPGDPAAVRPAGRVPDRPVRPRSRASSTSTTSPRWWIRERSWSAARARRTSSAPSRRCATVRAIADAQRLPAAGRRVAGRCCSSTGPSWCPPAASTCRRWTSTTCRSRSTSSWRRSAWVCCTPRSTCCERSLPFLYGGDMIAEGQVTADHVGYNELPWKYAAGTPNILGVIVSAQALRLVVDLVGLPAGRATSARRPAPAAAIEHTMHAVGGHTRCSPSRALEAVAGDPRPDDLRPGRGGAALAAGRLQRRRAASRGAGRGPRPSTASSRGPAATARPWRTETSGSTRRRAAGSASPLQHRRRRRPGRERRAASRRPLGAISRGAGRHAWGRARRGGRPRSRSRRARTE